MGTCRLWYVLVNFIPYFICRCSSSCLKAWFDALDDINAKNLVANTELELHVFQTMTCQFNRTTSTPDIKSLHEALMGSSKVRNLAQKAQIVKLCQPHLYPKLTSFKFYYDRNENANAPVVRQVVAFQWSSGLVSLYYITSSSVATKYTFNRINIIMNTVIIR